MVYEQVEGLIEGFSLALFSSNGQVYLPGFLSPLIPKKFVRLSQKVSLLVESLEEGRLLWNIIEVVVKGSGKWAEFEERYALRTQGLGVELVFDLRLIGIGGEEVLIDVLANWGEGNFALVTEKSALAGALGKTYYAGFPLEEKSAQFPDNAVNVLSGRDFWICLGGEGAYEEIVRAFKDAGREIEAELRNLLGK